MESVASLRPPVKPVPRTYIDGDGNRIERRGNPDKLGQLADRCQLGTGLDDCQVIRPNYVLMTGKDIRTDHLTIPLAPVTGVEDPALTRPGAENYFADAWLDGRAQVAQDLGTSADCLPRDAIALAVNSQNGRSQDRLHIHADRMDPVLGRQLKDQIDHGAIASDHWSNVAPIHGGHQYRALWVEGNDLTQNPFQLVHDQLAAEHGGGQAGEDYANAHMGQHTIAVVGETDARGRRGFVILDGRFGRDAASPNGPHDSASAEEWLLGHADAPP